MFDLSGNWAFYLPNHQIFHLNLEQKGSKLSGLGTPDDNNPFDTRILEGTLNEDVLVLTLGTVRGSRHARACMLRFSFFVTFVVFAVKPRIYETRAA